MSCQDQGPVAAGRRYQITIAAPGADAIEVWVDGWALGSFTGPAPFFSRTHDFTKSGDRLMTVQARAKGAVVGYRVLTVHLS